MEQSGDVPAGVHCLHMCMVPVLHMVVPVLQTIVPVLQVILPVLHMIVQTQPAVRARPGMLGCVQWHATVLLLQHRAFSEHSLCCCVQQALFPGKSSAHQQQLAAWLAAACGLPTTTSSSGSSDEGRPEQQVAASTLAALSSTIQRELFCRFGSSSSSASSNSSSSVGAPEVAAGLQQAVVSDAAGAGSGVSAAALRQLIEGLLRQHLQLMLTHNQEVAQHVWQQLQQAPAPAAPAQGLGGVGGWPHAEDPVWQQVAQYLQAQGGGCDVLPHLQAAARSGSRAGGEAVVRRCLLIPPECKVDLAAALIVACE